jgi:hypothetical protein
VALLGDTSSPSCVSWTMAPFPGRPAPVVPVSVEQFLTGPGMYPAHLMGTVLT